jgi:hypothetical protein
MGSGSVKPFQRRELPVIIPRDPKPDKDELARGMAAEHGVKIGPMGAINALEPSPASEHRGTHVQPRVKYGLAGP